MRPLLAAMSVATAVAAGLVDDPIASDAPALYLDGNAWTADNGNGTVVEGNVPGDLVTDLQKAGVIGDPLYENNFAGPNVWDATNWTYTTNFAYATPAADAQIYLVFDGIKMASDVYLNGIFLGYATDQFLRYEFPVSSYLAPAGQLNTLAVVLRPTKDELNVEGRFMACR